MRHDRYLAAGVSLGSRLQLDLLCVKPGGSIHRAGTLLVERELGENPELLEGASRDPGDLTKQSHSDAEIIRHIFQSSLYQGQWWARSNPSAPINNLKEQQTFRPLEKSITLHKQSHFATPELLAWEWKAPLYLLVGSACKGEHQWQR